MGSHSYDYPSGNPLNFLLAAFLFVVFILCLIFSSCSPTKRLGAISAKHPDAARRVFVAMFPPEIKTVTNTEIIPGKEIIRIDTVEGDCDPVIKYIDGKAVRVVQRIKVPCPPSISRVDTMLVTKTVTIENRAKIDLLSKDLADSQAKADKLKAGRNTWRYIALGAIVGLIGMAAFKLLFGKAKAAGKIIDKLD